MDRKQQNDSKTMSLSETSWTKKGQCLHFEDPQSDQIILTQD